MMKSLGLDMPVSSKKENGGQQNSQEDGIVCEEGPGVCSLLLTIGSVGCNTTTRLLKSRKRGHQTISRKETLKGE